MEGGGGCGRGNTCFREERERRPQVARAGHEGTVGAAAGGDEYIYS